MKNFFEKVQTLGNKAVQIQQAIQSVPPKIAEVRQAVSTAAGELQQLRSDVQSNLNGLRANSDHRMVEAMREIHDSHETWELVGYKLAGMDLDLALNQRLAVRLEKVADVPHADIRSLLAQEKSETIKCILTGLMKAEETADSIDLTNLKYHGLTVHLGAAPAIRMTWSKPGDSVAQTVVPVTATAPAVTMIAPPASAAISTTAVASAPALGSFFEQRTSYSKPATVSTAPSASALGAEVVVAEAASSQVVEEPAKTESESPWGRSALDRFKKMPNLSKHR